MNIMENKFNDTNAVYMFVDKKYSGKYKPVYIFNKAHNIKEKYQAESDIDSIIQFFNIVQKYHKIMRPISKVIEELKQMNYEYLSNITINYSENGVYSLTFSSEQLNIINSYQLLQNLQQN